MTEKGNFDNLCSIVTNVHENSANRELLETLWRVWSDEKDDIRKAIIIDQLASLESEAEKCQPAADYRTQLFPFCKCLFDQETFISLLDSSHQIRYAAIRLLFTVIRTNGDLSITASNLLSSIRPEHKLLWCRRALQFVSKSKVEPCRLCPGVSVGMVKSDQAMIDLLLGTWSGCLQNLSDQSISDQVMLDLLTTSHDLISNDLTKLPASQAILDSWPTIGQQILGLLSSSNRLIIRHLMEFLHALLANAFRDICSREGDWTRMEPVASNLLEKFNSKQVQSSIAKAASIETWFGGPLGNEGRHDPCLVRLYVLLPAMANAIMTNYGHTSPPEVPNPSLFPSIDLADPYSLVSILIDQDDHFCDFFLSRLIIQKSNPSCSPNAHQLWLHFLNHVGWSDEVVIDWLTSSETVFLIAFIRYLKLIIQDPNALRQETQHFPLASPILESPPTEKPDPIRIPIIEIIGDQEKRRDVILKPLRQRKSDHITPSFTDANVSDRTYQFFHQLEMKLERLHKKSLIGFNIQPLINLLHRVNK